jgi:hypothetical protein
MEESITTKITDLPTEFVVELLSGTDQSAVDSLITSLRSQILYNSRFEEEDLTEESVHVTVLSQEANRVKVRIEA